MMRFTLYISAPSDLEIMAEGLRRMPILDSATSRRKVPHSQIIDTRLAETRLAECKVGVLRLEASIVGSTVFCGEHESTLSMFNAVSESDEVQGWVVSRYSVPVL